MIRTSVRARLSIWHSGLLAFLVTTFAVASYGFLRRTELARIDSTLQEQSEIVAQAMSAVAAGGALTHTDSVGLLAVMHDLRARGLRAWVVDGAGRPIVTTAMVHEDEGAAEERRVLGDTLPAAVLREVGSDRADADRPTDGLDRLGARATVWRAAPRGTRRRRRHRLGVHSRPRCAVAGCAQRRGRGGARGGAALGNCRIRPGAPKPAPRDGDESASGPHRGARICTSDSRSRIRTTSWGASRRRSIECWTGSTTRSSSNAASWPTRRTSSGRLSRFLRGEADIALSSDGRTRDEYRGALVVVHDAADRLSRTVNDIFLLARVDASQVPTAPAPLYLDELVADTCRAMRSLAAQRGITLDVRDRR